LYETYITEAEGTKGTLKLGKGPVFKENSKHNLASAQLDTIRKKLGKMPKGKTAAANWLDKKITDTQPIIDGFGLMARINALNKLPQLPLIIYHVTVFSH
jgi:predicted oxidoreductase